MTKEELIVLRSSLLQEMNSIKNWFRDTDYIELQATRGTITRDSEKYLKYLESYNANLTEYKNLREEFRNTTIRLQNIEAGEVDEPQEEIVEPQEQPKEETKE